MACTAGALSDNSIISMPYWSIRRKPPVVQVEHAAFHLLPDAIGKVATGVANRVRDREMFLERDLAFHRSSPSNQGNRMCFPLP